MSTPILSNQTRHHLPLIRLLISFGSNDIRSTQSCRPRQNQPTAVPMSKASTVMTGQSQLGGAAVGAADVSGGGAPVGIGVSTTATSATAVAVGIVSAVGIIVTVAVGSLVAVLVDVGATAVAVAVGV